jgi:hypothetical protein
MDINNKGQLHEEVAQGTRARAAFDGYLRQFIQKQNASIFDAFLASENLLDLPKLKEYQLAIAALEQAVLTDIETGKLASLQLSELGR